jgi:hypothetical protein
MTSRRHLWRSPVLLDGHAEPLVAGWAGADRAAFAAGTAGADGQLI